MGAITPMGPTISHDYGEAHAAEHAGLLLRTTGPLTSGTITSDTYDCHDHIDPYNPPKR